jgi:hypothetical protein
MSENTVSAVCPNCLASNSHPASVCWLCKTPLPDSTPTGIQSIGPSPNSPFAFSIASLLLATTLCAAFFGIFINAPGLAILLAILSIPAFVRTGLILQRRSQLGKPIAAGQKFLWFLGSLTVTTTVVIVVGVASVGTFCAVCFQVAPGNPDAALPVAAITAGLATISVLVACAYWIRRRWRRDISRD